MNSLPALLLALLPGALTVQVPEQPEPPTVRLDTLSTADPGDDGEEGMRPYREVIPEDEIEGYGKRFQERKDKELGLIAEKREDSLED